MPSFDHLPPKIRREAQRAVDAGKYPNACPECKEPVYFGDWTGRGGHGNPFTPAANTDVETRFRCLACGHEQTRLL